MSGPVNSKVPYTTLSLSPIHTLMVISYPVTTADLGQNDTNEVAIKSVPPPIEPPVGQVGEESCNY